MSNAVKPNLRAILTAHCTGFQQIEDALYRLISARSVFTATGATLDLTGAMVGQLRSATGPDATDDNAYRALILGRIIVNTSDGEPEPLLSLMRYLGATAIKLKETGNASLSIQYTGDLLVTGPELIALLEQATVPVRLQVSEYTGPPFGFAGTPGAAGFGVGHIAGAIV